MKLKTILYISLGLATIGLMGWVLQSNKTKNAEKMALVNQTDGAVGVTVYKAALSPMQLSISGNGIFEATHELAFVSEVSGRITEILVKEGQTVQKGQLVAKTDNELLQAELLQAQANFDKLVKDQVRFQNAYKAGGITEKELDEITLNVKLAEARLTMAKRKVNDSFIKAPISGIINKKHIEIGTYLSPGTKLFDIVDVQNLELTVGIGEYQVGLLTEGAPVSITCQALPGARFEGKVEFIAAKADASLNYPVKISVANTSKNLLKAGMYGTATFEFNTPAPAFLVPRESFSGSIASGKLYVAENGKAIARQVTTGRVIGNQVEVLSGIRAGEQIITSGIINLENGTAIQITAQ